MQLADSQTLPPIVTLLALLFGLVAVAVKVTVAGRMERPPAYDFEAEAESPPRQTS